MPDVFAIEVELPTKRYASVNHLGATAHRGGPKSDDYRQLFEAVERAARAEMARTGWTTATEPCAAWWTRYTPHQRRVDAGNGNKLEADALQKAGVVADDTLLRPVTLHIEHDPAGPDRIAIVLMRRYPLPSEQPKPARASRKKPVLQPLALGRTPGMIGNRVVTAEEAYRAAGLTPPRGRKRAA